MSVTKIIRWYRGKFSDSEPWKIDHDEAMQVSLMEETLGDLANAIQAIIKIDQQLQGESLAAKENEKPVRRYQEWTCSLDSLLKHVKKILQKCLALAEKVHYFEVYHDRKYSREHFQSLVDQVQWCINPEAALETQLRPIDEVTRDFREGGCERCTPGK